MSKSVDESQLTGLASYADAWMENRGVVMVTTLDRDRMDAIGRGWLGTRQRLLVPGTDLGQLTVTAIEKNADGRGLAIFQSVRGVEGGYARKCAAQFSLLEL